MYIYVSLAIRLKHSWQTIGAWDLATWRSQDQRETFETPATFNGLPGAQSARPWCATIFFSAIQAIHINWQPSYHAKNMIFVVRKQYILYFMKKWAPIRAYFIIGTWQKLLLWGIIGSDPPAYPPGHKKAKGRWPREPGTSAENTWRFARGGPHENTWMSQEVTKWLVNGL